MPPSLSLKRYLTLLLSTVFILSSVLVSTPNVPVLAQDGDSIQINQFIVTFSGRHYDAGSNQTTFTYLVEGTGNPPDLSHFDIEIPHCDDPLTVVSYSPSDAVSFGIDPTTGVDGIKWDIGLSTSQTRTYTITFEGNVAAGSVLIAVKGGPGFEADTLPGGSCNTPSVNVEKSVSLDGTTWHDADEPTGLDIPLDGQVWFQFQIMNDGNLDISGLMLSDDMLDVSSCVLPEILEPEASVQCIVGPLAVVEGQHTNVATVTANTNGEVLTDTDSANYWGGNRPSIDVEKHIAVDGGITWDDADSPTGSNAVIGDPVQFRFTVTNDGNVALTNLSLTDDMLDLSACVLPETLEPQASVECMSDPAPAVEGQHVNTALVTGMFGDQSVTDSDSAHYLGGADNDLPITIIIDGSVQSINGNIIVIYGFSITLDPNDPVLVNLQVGDVLQIHGNLGDSNIIIAVIVIIIADYDDDIDIDFDIDIDTGNDDVYVRPECRNPPPPWAPAHGWRRKCEGR